MAKDNNYTWIDKYGNGVFICTDTTEARAVKYMKECLKDGGAGWQLETVEAI